jgi:hypothetical protein
MKRILLPVLAISVLSVCGVFDAAHGGHRLGGGIHYLRTLGDIKDVPEWDANSVGFIASYQFTFTLIKLEGDLEFIPNYGGTDKTMFQPEAWVLVGGLIYGSLGAGIGYIDDEWQDNPFYALRAGVDLAIGKIGLDVYATYRFQSSKELEDFDTKDLDSVTFAVVARFGL